MPHRMRHARRQGSNTRALRWASLGLAVIGLLDSVYLLVYKLSGNNRMCLGNGGCHDVNFSSYSEFHGIPVSILGILAYLMILAVLFLELRWKTARAQGPLVVFGLSLVGVLYSTYLTYLELEVIHAVCPFCVTSAVVISLIFILAIIRLIQTTLSQST